MVSETARIEPRTSAVIRARLRGPEGEREVTVIDASSRGMLAMMADAPARGEIVELVVGAHSLVGEVRWRVGKRFGLAFRERISVAALLEGGTGSIRLASQMSARRGVGGLLATLTVDPGLCARSLQFAVALAVLGGAAWGISGMVGERLGALSAARQAMAGEAPVSSATLRH